MSAQPGFERPAAYVVVVHELSARQSVESPLLPGPACHVLTYAGGVRLIDTERRHGQQSRVGDEVAHTLLEGGHRVLWSDLDGDVVLYIDPASTSVDGSSSSRLLSMSAAVAP